MAGIVSARLCIRPISWNAVRNHRTLSVPTFRTFQTSSLLHRSPAYPGHIPLNTFENAFLTAGSALMAFMDPRRGGKPL